MSGKGKPYSPETLSLVADAIAWIQGSMDQAEAALDALWAAGLLAKDGAENRQFGNARLADGLILPTSFDNYTHYRQVCPWMPVEE